MSEPLTPDEVAIIIRAKRLLKEKGLAPDTDVKTICSAAGISRDDPTKAELSRLKAEHEKLKKAFDDVSWENEGRKVAWEIHEVDAMIAEKKSTMARHKSKKR